jgi:asparagine synthase (glutamine-hydrolysing)
MCGIAGIIRKNQNSDPIDIKSLEEMSKLIKHRGPDSHGIHIDQNREYGLAHRRLSIVDLTSSGDQPMKCPSGNWIVYNGEVYNYKEIASRLGLKELESKSDTQVILAAYAKWGKDCVKEFRGMFAFAIWDKKEQYLFCARDHFGVKPFYYYESNNSVYFAS